MPAAANTCPGTARPWKAAPDWGQMRHLPPGLEGTDPDPDAGRGSGAPSPRLSLSHTHTRRRFHAGTTGAVQLAHQDLGALAKRHFPPRWPAPLQGRNPGAAPSPVAGACISHGPHPHPWLCQVGGRHCSLSWYVTHGSTWEHLGLHAKGPPSPAAEAPSAGRSTSASALHQRVPGLSLSLRRLGQAGPRGAGGSPVSLER